MILKFTTKRDANGNRYTLKIDTESKQAIRSCNPSRDYSDYIEITKRERERLADECEAQGFAMIYS